MNYKLPVQTTPYVMMSSDFSQQEPKLTAFVASESSMIEAFKTGKDIYATIAAISFGKTYEQCLEFHPETHEYQKEGKDRRTEAKSVVLGILYGRSTKTIGDQLYGKDESLTDEERSKKAQTVYDSVLNSFPGLKSFMYSAQKFAHDHGYVETILGRRRHIPDMTLPEFEFKPMTRYVNPDIDPLDPETLKDQSVIPQRIVDSLYKEFTSYKYFGQVVKRTKELKADKIQVINHRPQITQASRKCVNCVDVETEILTLDGWKHYDEIHVGTQIYSYNLNSRKIEEDKIQNVIVSFGETEVVRFINDDIDALTTPNHKWLLTADFGEASLWFQTTEDISKIFVPGRYEQFSSNHRLFGIIHELDNVLETKSLEPSESSVTDFHHDRIEIIQGQVVDRVWCVTTNNHTWIARRNGKMYVTSNSIIQGSAADLTKMAILNVFNNEEWQRLGGRILTPIHDEILCEIPMENWERGGELLSQCMCDAADFLPFPISCDVETTLRWYGNEFPTEHPKPKEYPTQDKEEIKWIQWCLLEMEYILPVYKDENGDTPRGEAANGINGIISDEYQEAIDDYIHTHKISEDEFLDTIEQEVIYGL